LVKIHEPGKFFTIFYCAAKNGLLFNTHAQETKTKTAAGRLKLPRCRKVVEDEKPVALEV
jgi:hypothetical protein